MNMMMNNELDTKTIKVATQVIISAGNARALAYEGLNLAETGHFQEAEEKMQQADSEIACAHVTQTEVIQAEARGDPLQITLLLTHAQDSLMMAMSELQLIARLINIYKRFTPK